MNKKILMLAALAALPLTASFRFKGEELKPVPSEGTRVSRTFEFAMDLTLEDFVMEVNGEEQEIPEVPEGTLGFAQTIGVDDVYVSVGDARPTSLKRTFTELAETNTQSMADQENEREGTSELEGRTVVFDWDADGEEYGIRYGEDEEGDEDLIADLEEDMDLRGFLPDGEVEEGATWECGVESFKRLFSPGGDLHIRSEDQDEDDPNPSDQLDDNLDGTVTCTFNGMSEVEGVRVALIGISGSVSTDAEMENEGEGPPMIQTLELSMEFEGELRWNAAAGHLHSFDVSGEAELDVTMESSFSNGDQEIELAQVISYAGSVTWKGEVTAGG